MELFSRSGNSNVVAAGWEQVPKGSGAAAATSSTQLPPGAPQAQLPWPWGAGGCPQGTITCPLGSIAPAPGPQRLLREAGAEWEELLEVTQLLVIGLQLGQIKYSQAELSLFTQIKSKRV